MTDYLRNPEEIYRKSFAIVREETDLSRVSTEIAEIVTRLVHACGMPEIASDIAYSDGLVSAGRTALADGKSIVTDVRMLDAGIIRHRLPASNPVLCAIGDEGLAEEAKSRNTTRSAVAIEKLSDAWTGGIVAIGSAPTALFRVLEMINDGAPPPAVIDIATNKPVIITPKSIAPTDDNAATCPPMGKINKYKTIGDRTGNSDGIIISLIAALVNKSTNLP